MPSFRPVFLLMFKLLYKFHKIISLISVLEAVNEMSGHGQLSTK